MICDIEKLSKKVCLILKRTSQRLYEIQHCTFQFVSCFLMYVCMYGIFQQVLKKQFYVHCPYMRQHFIHLKVYLYTDYQVILKFLSVFKVGFKNILHSNVLIFRICKRCQTNCNMISLTQKKCHSYHRRCRGRVFLNLL